MSGLDSETLEKAQRGDEAAVRAVLTHFETDVRSYVTGMSWSLDEFDREAALIEIWTKIIRGLPQFQMTGSLRGWIRTIARNHLVDLGRIERRWVGELTIDGVVPEEPVARNDPAEIYEAADTQRARQLIASLSTRDQQIAWLKYVDRYANPEIAQSLGISQRAVGKAVTRIRKALGEGEQ